MTDQGICEEEEGERLGAVPQPAQQARHLHTEHGRQVRSTAVHQVFEISLSSLKTEAG
jgi:hypothetical protein